MLSDHNSGGGDSDTLLIDHLTDKHSLSSQGHVRGNPAIHVPGKNHAL